MSNSSVIVRRVLRHRIKSDQGLQKVVSELLGDDWQSMLNSSRRSRDGIVQKLAGQIDQLLCGSSFTRQAEDTVDAAR